MYTLKYASDSVKPRIRIERKIVRSVLYSALQLGYSVSVFDGEEEHPVTTNPIEAEKQLMETDGDYLFIYDPKQPVTSNGIRVFGWVRFIYGNDGWDVINDYSVNLDKTEILTEAERLADYYESREL